jgi:hypothetical protein
MPNGWLFYTLLLLLIAYAFWLGPLLDRRKKIAEKYSAAWRLYEVENGFLESTVNFSRDGKTFSYVTRIASEFEHKNGRRGIGCRAKGFAIHEINVDGSFSKRAPYFVRRTHPRKWNPTGRQHVVEFVTYPAGHFPSSNPNQTNGEIFEIGNRVIEFDTQKEQRFSDVHAFYDSCSPLIREEYASRTAGK